MGAVFNPAIEEPLPGCVETLFSFRGERARSVQRAMVYQYVPQRSSLDIGGLLFDVTLNHNRYAYVRDTLHGLSKATGGKAAATETHDKGKRTLCPHMPPPGETVCPFDDVTQSPLMVRRVAFDFNEYGLKDYSLVINSRPWGYCHTMLLTVEPEPQIMTERELLASLLTLEQFGATYEGIFTGAGAGASIFHFHLQIRKSDTALWRNLAEGRVRLTPITVKDGVVVSRLTGWPARAYVFDGPTGANTAGVVYRMLGTLAAGENDIPYNLGPRCHEAGMRVILFPRSSMSGETPTGLNPHPESWGRFAFMDLGGSLFVLTPEGYEATIRAPEGICSAISQMSVSVQEEEALIRSFLS